MPGGIPQNLLANLSVRMGMDTKAFDIGTRKANKNISSLNSTISGFKALFGAAFGLATIRMLSQFSKIAEDAYRIQASAETKLQTVMRQRMGATDDMIDSIKNLTKEEQKLGVIGDEIQLSGAQQLATFLKQKDALDLLIPAMNNLVAQQKGYEAQAGDAVNVANMMGKVLDGQVGALRRVGISFTNYQEKMLKGGDEMQRAATLAEVITSNVGEMNKELAKTDLGKLQQMKNLLSDIKEDIGAKIVPLKVEFLTTLQQELIIWQATEINFWQKLTSTLFESDERRAEMIDKIAEKKDELQKKADSLGDINVLRRMFLTDDEKAVEDLAKVTIDKAEADDKASEAIEKQIPLLQKAKDELQKYQDSFDESVSRKDLLYWGQKVQIAKDYLKQLESIGSLEYFKKLEEKAGLKKITPKVAPVVPTTPETMPSLPGVTPDYTSHPFDWLEVAKDDVERINQEIADSFKDLAIDMTDSFLEMATSGEGFQPGNLLIPIANVAENLGKLAIGTGIATLGIKKALESLSGPVAIAAGIALIALAKMVKAKAAAMASGASVNPNVPSFTPGSNTDRTSTRYYGEVKRPEMHVTFDEIKISGETLRIGVKRAEIKHNLNS